WFSHLLMNLKEEMNTNMVGFLYSGADTAGFGDHTTPDLALRWLELGIFSPLLRNHSSRRLRRQEFYLFGMEDAFRGMLKLRYALIPYIYSEFVKAVLRDDLLFKPLSFVYEDDAAAKQVEDQAMLGESVMIAPVYEQNADGRYVYVPEDMKLYRFRSPEDYDTKVLAKGRYYIHTALNEVLLFVRKGHAVPFADVKDVLSTADLRTDTLTALKYDESPVSYELYDDDGFTREISEAGIRTIPF
ncbi:MAG: alpha-glucosidase, partial [Lachnospiraceae bacterium]|nr:alpha-glucosidase [Lachnospiraceae bacterium]